MMNQIKKFWVKNYTKFILLTTIVFFLIGLVNFFFIFEITAQSNDECLWVMKKATTDSTAIEFQFVKENGVTWNAGIRDGDYLLSIDGVRTYDLITASRILDGVRAGDYATYKVDHKGKIFETKVLVKKLINFFGFAIALLSFLWLIVGFVVVMAKPEGTTQRLFYRISLFAILFAMLSLLYRGQGALNPLFESKALLVTVDTLWTLGGSFLGFMLVRFFCIFPNENKLIKKKWFNRFLLIAPFVMFVAVEAIKFFYAYQDPTGRSYNILANVIGITLGVTFIAGLVFLFLSYIKLSNKRERNSIFVILVAYLIGVLALIYTSTLAAAIAGLIFNNPAYFTPIILLALLPIAFGYSIFHYSLMDVSEVVKNTVVYGVATIMLAALYFLLIYVIGQSVSSAIGTEYQGIIFGAVFVLFAVVFQSTKDKFQEFLTAKFYPEQFSYQKGLLEFNGAIASVVGRQNIFDAIQKLFVQVLQIEAFGLLLKNESGMFELVRYQGISNNRLSLHNDKPVIENYCLECMMLGKKQVIERQDFAEILGSSANKFLAEEIYTIIPLFINSKLIGLLLIGLKHSGSQFTGKDLDLLISASLQTAISIENARLYESEAEKQKIQRDLENARHIQETLLPKVVPQINNLNISGKMIPAMHVGGDYFDLIKISDTKLFVVVGDVSGKGLSASFYMSKLQTMIRLYCTDGKSPREILVEVNSRISESIEKNWFITVTLGLFDVEKKSLTVCRAGHTSIVRIRNGKLESLQPAGMGIGLDRGEVFSNSLEEAVYKLENNDLYFFYSDGVTELMNENDELFGEERLGKSLLMNAGKSCNDIEAGLIKELSDFRGKTPQYDDVTTLLVKYKD